MSSKRRSLADEPFLLVRSSTSDLAPASEVAAHSHAWHQLTCVSHGLMVVTTGAGAWVTPASCAVWAPAGTLHAIRFVGVTGLRVLYLRPETYDVLPQECRSLMVSALLRELVARTCAAGMLDSREPTEAAMAQLIAAELCVGGPPPLSLPEPDSPAMRQAARLIVADHASAQTAAELARALNLGGRTLERRFQAETGMSLGRWRQQRQLLYGLELVAGGALVKTAASMCGFASASAFVAAFRRVFGVTPQRFFAQRGEALARPGECA